MDDSAIQSGDRLARDRAATLVCGQRLDRARLLSSAATQLTTDIIYWLRFAIIRFASKGRSDVANITLVGMGTPQQDQANRRNGRRGKGRKTAEGKAISARNSLKHGLTSSEVLMPNENAGAFATFCERLRKELNPGGELESLLAEQIIGIAWRLRRLGKIEAGILTWRYYEIQIERSQDKADKHSIGNKISSDIGEYNLKPAEQEERKRALAKRQEHRSAQESDLATCGEAFIVDSRKENALAKLSRYETSMTRGLFRTLHELQRLQAARKGKDVPVPLAVDVDVYGLAPRAIDGTVLDQASDAAD